MRTIRFSFERKYLKPIFQLSHCCIFDPRKVPADKTSYGCSNSGNSVIRLARVTVTASLAEARAASYADDRRCSLCLLVITSRCIYYLLEVNICHVVMCCSCNIRLEGLTCLCDYSRSLALEHLNLYKLSPKSNGRLKHCLE